jgi:hypothetical protein
VEVQSRLWDKPLESSQRGIVAKPLEDASTVADLLPLLHMHITKV